MDTANSIDDTPVMDEKGADITPKSSEIVFDKVDFSYADRKILNQVSFTIPEKTTKGEKQHEGRVNTMKWLMHIAQEKGLIKV